MTSEPKMICYARLHSPNPNRDRWGYYVAMEWNDDRVACGAVTLPQVLEGQARGDARKFCERNNLNLDWAK